MRPRFSLRWLFLATAAVAALCYWLIYPTVVAHRFICALEAQDYKLADTYFANLSDRNFAEWHDKHWHFKATAQLDPQTFHQILQGHRLITLSVTRGDATVRMETCSAVVARKGVLTPMVVGGVSGFGIMRFSHSPKPLASGSRL